MSLSPEHAAQLQLYAQVAVAFAGFAGVIGAFSQFRMHAEATAFRVRSMVTLAVGEVLFSLLPANLAGFGMAAETAWRVSGFCFGAIAAVLLVLLGRQAARLYRLGRLMRRAAFVLIAAGFVAIAPLLGAAIAAPRHVGPLYFNLLFFGMIVCSYHFVMLIVAVRLDESE